MSIPNLPTDFKDDILNTGVNQKRKYQQTYNSDGSVSFDDVTSYSQQGSDFGAQQVNETNGAVNNIYAERIVDLDELDLVTEPGFFVDALAVKELNSKLQGLLADPEDIELDLNTSGFTSNSTWAQRVGRQVTVYPQVSGVPVKGRTIATGLPAPSKIINVRDPNFGIVEVYLDGTLLISSAAVTSASYFLMPFTYWAEE